jgi:DNA-binding beta-propeller fold protein YncE
MQTISVLFVLGLSAVAMTTPAVGGYRLLQTIAIAGDDGWDHPTVDSAARRLYVTHGTHVVVIDVDSGKLVGKIDNTPGVHFTVIDPELDRGFISNGGAARLTIFNTNTLETIGHVKSTGENPGPTVFDPATKRVFTFNLNSHNATVVTPKKAAWSALSTWAGNRNLSARMQKEMFLPT